MFRINFIASSREIALRWMPQNNFDNKSTLVQVMAWCRQATGHYLRQCWPWIMSPYDVTRPQWFKILIHQLQFFRRWHLFVRDHFVYAPSKWETMLQCNVASHWVGAYTKWSLICTAVFIWIDTSTLLLCVGVWSHIYVKNRYCNIMRENDSFCKNLFVMLKEQTIISTKRLMKSPPKEHCICLFNPLSFFHDRCANRYSSPSIGTGLNTNSDMTFRCLRGKCSI